MVNYIGELILQRHNNFQTAKTIIQQLCTELQDKVADLSSVGKARQAMSKQDESWNRLTGKVEKKVSNILAANQVVEVGEDDCQKYEEMLDYGDYQQEEFGFDSVGNGQGYGQNNNHNHSQNQKHNHSTKKKGIKNEYNNRAMEYSAAFDDYLNGIPSLADEFLPIHTKTPQTISNDLQTSRLSLYDPPKKPKKPAPMTKFPIKGRDENYRAQINQQYLDVNIFVSKVLLPRVQYHPDGVIPKKIILNNYFHWKFSTGRRILVSDSGIIQMELTVRIKALFKKAGHNRKFFKGLKFKEEFQEQMNLTDKVKPSWLNDDSPFDGRSHLDPLQNSYYRQVSEKDVSMNKYDEYIMMNNQSQTPDQDDLRYSKYEIQD